MSNIASIRKEYLSASLSENEVDKNPFIQFDQWWQQAVDSKIDEVNAMTLSTVSTVGKPSARIVLLKGYDKNGFVFFTNYKSKKGIDIETNPNVSLIFFWKELERQVRIEGVAEKISANESDEYFNSRPISSRIGAWASPQSTKIDSREFLENNVVKVETQFAHNEIYRPAFWGGYIVKPSMIEFWQGRPSRLHDRISYNLVEGSEWELSRLAP